MLEDLHIGVAVHGSDHHHLGKLSRVVIEPAGEQITHVVVKPGLAESGNLLKPGGWEEPRERVVPVALIAVASKDDVRLACDETAFQQLPLFERKEYADVDVMAGAGASGPALTRFQLGELVNYISSGWGLGAAPYVAPADISLNETPTAINIEDGSPVWRIHPHEEIGVVERVLVDATTQRVSALVMRRTGLFRHRVLLPIERVSNVDDGVVHTTLSDDEIGTLAPYEEEE